MGKVIIARCVKEDGIQDRKETLGVLWHSERGSMTPPSNCNANTCEKFAYGGNSHYGKNCFSSNRF